ncbi:MAG TPA: FlgO family outer membrane protein [Chthoniobacterales bacterium]|nr:FlgO family outer membrane protein [Chthoniobacterales bacterium]
MQPEVLISYSSQDKALADTICQRLESEGIRCWIAPRDIDVGSDWTEGVMRGIETCRVFVLVFSANANDSEHVRREVAKAFSLKLAVIPFRTEAVTPNRSLGYFLETVQWLNATDPPLQQHLGTLAARIKQLPVNESDANAVAGQPVQEIKPKRLASSKPSLSIVGIALAGVAIMIGAAAWLHTTGNQNRQQTSMGGILTTAPEKSVAVLPFESLSDNKGDGYFADGVQDEILNNLATIAELKVVSRTSVMPYRADTNRDLRQIAATLGVAHVLEGTVRRSGNRVRVSTKLIDARNDKTIWADSFDRDLTDIFAIQSSVAKTVAAKLFATLSPDEKKSIEAKPTEIPEAYDLYLRAKELLLSAEVSSPVGNLEKLQQAIGFLEQAVRLDPSFTLAYCAMTKAHDLLYLYDPTSERRAAGDVSINHALSLQPDLPEVQLAYAYHLYFSWSDYDRARFHLSIARRDLPNNGDAIMLEAWIDLRQRNFEKANRELNEAIARDPGNSVSILSLAISLFYMRQFVAAERTYDRVIELLPEQAILKVQKAYFLTTMKNGDDAGFWSAIAALPSSIADDPGVVCWQMNYALADRNWPLAKSLLEKMKQDEDNQFAYAEVAVPVGCYAILLARLETEGPAADSNFARTREQLNKKVQKSPGNAQLLSSLAVVDALLGHKKASISEAERAVEMLPTSKDALVGSGIVTNLAVVYAWNDELDQAFATLEPLTNISYGIYYGQLKLDPYWEPLRKDPRFERLLSELAPKK